MTTAFQNLSFEDAIAVSETWLTGVAQGDYTDEQILADLTQILSQPNGVRGFFVTFLTGDSPLGDHPPAIFLQVFQATAEHIKTIVVKNLAMSTAMILTHDRSGDMTQKAGSEQVQQRSLTLLNALNTAPFQQERSALLHSLKTGTGDYGTFLDRWGYDGEQRQAIQAALETLS